MGRKLGQTSNYKMLAKLLSGCYLPHFGIRVKQFSGTKEVSFFKIIGAVGELVCDITIPLVNCMLFALVKVRPISVPPVTLTAVTLHIV